jgi:hypothetical protein
VAFPFTCTATIRGTGHDDGHELYEADDVVVDGLAAREGT